MSSYAASVDERLDRALLDALKDDMKRGQPNDQLPRALAWDRFWLIIYQETKERLLAEAEAERMPAEPPTDRPQPQPFDSNKRWYDEYHDTFHRLCLADAENIKLIQRIHVLEREAQSRALTESAIYSLGSTDLLRFAKEHAALARAIVAELRKRHIELPDELRDL